MNSGGDDGKGDTSHLARVLATAEISLAIRRRWVSRAILPHPGQLSDAYAFETVSACR